MHPISVTAIRVFRRSGLGRSLPVERWDTRVYPVVVRARTGPGIASGAARRAEFPDAFLAVDQQDTKRTNTTMITPNPMPSRSVQGRQSHRLRRISLGWMSFVLTAAGPAAYADTVTLEPAADTFINSRAPANNAGGHTHFAAGRDNLGGVRRGLIRFDLGSIPAGSTITSAEVRLKVTQVPRAFGRVDSMFDLRRLNVSWGEGSKTGNNGLPATAGEANWTARTLGTDNWTTPGALDDAASAPSASVMVTGADNAVYSWSSPDLIADVQHWVDNPDDNHGWLLTSRAENQSKSARGFGSRESAGNGGQLIISYEPAQPLELTDITVEAGEVHLSWSGGAGPFAIQRKQHIDDPLWDTAAVTSGTESTLASPNATGFFRVVDTADQPGIPFSAWLTGSAQRPDPVDTPGSGFGLFKLDGNTLTFSLSYSGLKAAATAAHIHGPAGVDENGSVLIDLAPHNGDGFGESGTLSGVIDLTDEQRALIMAGQTYVNIHTPSHQPGEIRGQIAPVLMQTQLSGDNARPNPVATPAHGLGTLTLVGNQLSLNVTYRDLKSAATAAHIHGPADANSNAGVLVSLESVVDGALGTSGSFSGTLSLSPEQLAHVIAGRTYINIHTPDHQPGEIRGQLRPQPAAVPLTASLSGLHERPDPITNNAAGSATLMLAGQNLTLNAQYAALEAAAVAAHLHGPAATSENAGVLVGLDSLNGGALGIDGTFSGTVDLTEEQRTQVLNGLTYLNVHTSVHQPGEIRGQVAPVLMMATLSGANARPDPIDSPATGLAVLALRGSELDMVVAYNGLTAPATAAHIHGPADASGTAGVLVDLSPLNGGGFGTSGFLSGTVSLTPDQLSAVIDGLTYINIHTSTHKGGEIRGQISR